MFIDELIVKRVWLAWSAAPGLNFFPSLALTLTFGPHCLRLHMRYLVDVEFEPNEVFYAADMFKLLFSPKVRTRGLIGLATCVLGKS